MNNIATAFYNIIEYPSEIVVLKDSANLLIDENYNIKPYLQYINSNSIGNIQEYYSETFDFNENTSLYVASQIEKNINKRMSLIARFADIFVDNKLLKNELPDYVPNLVYNLDDVINYGIDFVDKINTAIENIMYNLNDNIYQCIYKSLNMYIKTMAKGVLL